MKKIFLFFLSLFCFNSVFSQELKVNVINIFAEIKSETYHIRANKGDILRFNIHTEVKNEKKQAYNELKRVTIYRQFASEPFQYIFDKYDVSKIDSFEIRVPSKGVYTLKIERGGSSKFNTDLKVDRIPENIEMMEIKTKAIRVQIPDTIHTYLKDSILYDYIRVSTPIIKEETIPTYYEDQIFIDKAYALRVDNKYVVPIQIPIELYNKYKKQNSVKWGYIISVGDEVYKALQKKVASIATAAVQAGAGKIMSGKTDEATGLVQKNGVQKAYDVFDKTSTANEIASIAGDFSEVSKMQKGVQASNQVTKITGFTGLTEAAMAKASEFIPKIEDQIIFKLLNETEYSKYLNKQPYNCIKQGKSCYAADTFNLGKKIENYYLILENERKLSGGALAITETLVKTYLSQYVYFSLKVFVQRETNAIYHQGYYDRQTIELYNPIYKHKEEIKTTEKVIFEDEIKSYYKILDSSNIY